MSTTTSPVVELEAEEEGAWRYSSWVKQPTPLAALPIRRSCSSIDDSSTHPPFPSSHLPMIRRWLPSYRALHCVAAACEMMMRSKLTKRK